MFRHYRAAYGAGFRHGAAIAPMLSPRMNARERRYLAAIKPRTMAYGRLQGYCWRQGAAEGLGVQPLYVKLFLFFWRG